MSDPITNANVLNDSTITGNGKAQITGPVMHAVIAAVIGAVTAAGGVALKGSSSPTFLPSGTGGSLSICLTAGQSATLPSNAPANSVVSASDCSNDPAAPQPLSQPETINASTDATIAGATSYQITLTGQGVGFRKTLAGPWQPF